MRVVAGIFAVALMGAGMARAEDAAATSAPATMAATATAPATAPSLSEKLFGDRGDTPPLPSTAPSTEAAVVTETLPPVGPTEAKVKGLEEGTILARRVVRLTVDKQTGEYVAVFEGDGKVMADPPMVVMPSSRLQMMEKVSEFGKRAVRFQITGQVTEYKGRNYILISDAVPLKEMNSGISGG